MSASEPADSLPTYSFACTDYERDGSEDDEEVEVLEDENPMSARSSQATSSTGRTMKKRKTSSWIHQYFSVSTDGMMHCILCVPSSGGSSTSVYSSKTGTSSLSRHLKVAHRIEKGNASPLDPAQTLIRADGGLDHHNIIDDERRAQILKSLVRFVVEDKQSFSIVQKPAFHGLVKSLNRFYNIPSRDTLVRAINDQYGVVHQQFRTVLDSIPGCVALTCDGWSSRIMRGYFVITVHWICSDWVLRSCVLDFKYFPTPHNTLTTCDLLHGVIIDNNLQTRIRAVTTDSASEMAPALDLVRNRLNEGFGLRLQSTWHIRCICHVMNRAAVDAAASNYQE
jgi:hypothetical protein